MKECCSNKGCSSNHHDSNNCHAEHECCSENHQCCDSHHHTHQGHEDVFSEWLLEVADEAWKEVLKDEIKKHILSSQDRMSELAKIVSEANHHRWKGKMETKHCCAEFKEKICDFFKSLKK